MSERKEHVTAKDLDLLLRMARSPDGKMRVQRVVGCILKVHRAAIDVQEAMNALTERLQRGEEYWRAQGLNDVADWVADVRKGLDE